MPGVRPEVMAGLSETDDVMPNEGMITFLTNRPILSATFVRLARPARLARIQTPLFSLIVLAGAAVLSVGCASSRHLDWIALGAVQQRTVVELAVEGQDSDLDGWVQVGDERLELVDDPRDAFIQIAQASAGDPETQYLCLKLALMISRQEERLDSWIRYAQFMESLPSPALAALLASIHVPIGESAWLNTLDVDSGHAGVMSSLEPGRVIALDVVRRRVDQDAKLAQSFYLASKGVINDSEPGLSQALMVAVVAAELNRQVAGATLSESLAQVIRDCTDWRELSAVEVAEAIRAADTAEAHWAKSFQVAQHRADQIIEAMRDGDTPRSPVQLGYGTVRP